MAKRQLRATMTYLVHLKCAFSVYSKCACPLSVGASVCVCVSDLQDNNSMPGSAEQEGVLIDNPYASDMHLGSGTGKQVLRGLFPSDSHARLVAVKKAISCSRHSCTPRGTHARTSS